MPQEAMLGPSQGLPISRGQGGGDLPDPEAPAPLALFAFCRFSILVDLCFYFRERHVSSLSVSNS